jgi:signal transduction histidine kinase
MKASQAISGEIVLDKLLASLMKILIENAGAQKGFLILDKAGEWVIEASGEVNADKVTVLQSIPIDQHLPASIINYVTRTRETIVKNDAAQQGKFTNDPYIKANKTKSILCAPLLNQGQLNGIVYLENNLTTGAFTPDRLEVIQLLSGQAAIAIENAQLYNNLEQKVSDRTQELAQALDDLKATQDELIQSAKMAALGQLISGIAHEVNTPLGAIRSSAESVSQFLSQSLEELPLLLQSLSSEEVENFLALVQKSLESESNLSAKEERKLKKALIRQLEDEEIEDADEFADTLIDMGIYQEVEPFFTLLKRPDGLQILEIAYRVTELQRGMKTISTATDRASKVVFALKTYARYDSSGEKIPTNLIEGIETVLTLYHNQLKQGVEVIRNYVELPPVLGYPDELNQVWTNLVHNALQAMDNRGTLTIDVMQQEGEAKISITDSGKGIPAEIMSKIFEPFFTTKPPGEGSGLGLDIVRKIIKKHQGRIEVDSVPGKSTFTVFLAMRHD